ncbi:MAG: hypothetical protein H6918_09880 [Sphingomonadaceae bacterium]|nr:hypothetical protein [Sphingomonadaceae bacterium]
MSKQPDPSAFAPAESALETAPDAAPKTTHRHDGWSLEKQVAFLRALSASHSVSVAAKSVGMSRQSAYRLRSKLKGQAFDLAWEVAFHHSYDVLAHAALERALNGVEVPVYFQGEQVGSYRRYDERLTVALLNKFTLGGNPRFGRLGPMAERHARDFEGLLGRLEAGKVVRTGAPAVSDPGEIAAIHARSTARYGSKVTDSPSAPCPSAWSDEELMAALEEVRKQERK